MQESRYFALAVAFVTLGVLVAGGFALGGAPSTQALPPPASSPNLHLEIVPGTAAMPATYSSLHAMVRHGPVTITIVNHDARSHGFDVPKLGISLDIPAGATVTYATTITQTGLFDWFCWHPCPGDASPLAGGNGMSGDLAVV